MPVSAGGRIYASTINTIAQSANEKPVCRVTAGATQNLANNTVVPLAFSAEEIDTHNIHDITTNNSRITPTVAGYYEFSGACFFPSKSDWTNVNIFVRTNGTNAWVSNARLGTPAVTGGSWSLNLQPIIILMNGTTDYAELCAQQSNTAATTVATTNGGGQSNLFTATFVRPS
jgi:hypothetical protein